MIQSIRRNGSDRRLLTWLGVVAVLAGAALLGWRASARWSLLLFVVVGGAIGLRHAKELGLLAVVAASLVLPMQIGTGTAVDLNAATLITPTLLSVWLLDKVRTRDFRFARSRANRPLVLFLVAGLLSLVVGTATWDPVVPRSDKFLIVQLAQWAIFAFAAGAFWLAANLGRGGRLRQVTWFYLGLAGSLAILGMLPWTRQLVQSVATFAMYRAPFWALLTAMAGGQLLFNRRLSASWRWFLVAALGSATVYAFVLARVTASNWVGVAAVIGVLVWLRWPRLRWLIVLALVALTLTGLLSSTVYEFAGGDAEWEESGGSRLVLIERVIKVTMRNPITGLGPAAYRPYAAVEPLLYGRAYWVVPQVNSHNNWVDLFSHVGLLGLGVFVWFAIEIILLGFRLRQSLTTGFYAGYVNAAIAAWVSALVLMLLADWILPFVYNVGFSGFQASLPMWLFVGGLVALETHPAHELPDGATAS